MTTGKWLEIPNSAMNASILSTQQYPDKTHLPSMSSVWKEEQVTSFSGPTEYSGNIMYAYGCHVLYEVKFTTSFLHTTIQQIKKEHVESGREFLSEKVSKRHGDWLRQRLLKLAIMTFISFPILTHSPNRE